MDRIGIDAALEPPCLFNKLEETGPVAAEDLRARSRPAGIPLQSSREAAGALQGGQALLEPGWFLRMPGARVMLEKQAVGVDGDLVHFARAPLQQTCRLQRLLYREDPRKAVSPGGGFFDSPAGVTIPSEDSC